LGRVSLGPRGEGGGGRDVVEGRTWFRGWAVAGLGRVWAVDRGSTRKRSPMGLTAFAAIDNFKRLQTKTARNDTFAAAEQTKK
jgi:hypothetical protein